MDDLISRQDAIEEIARRDTTDGTVKVYSGREVCDILNALPTAEMQGKWECCTDDDGEYGICSVCGSDADFAHYGEPYKYCPNCGARMDGGEDDS